MTSTRSSAEDRTREPERAPRVGWIVDVQDDFMLPPEQGGRLYVHDLFDSADPGAERARGRIEAAVAWMRDNCDVLVYTGDWHSYEDAEIDPVAPDPEKGTYPPHCMGRSEDPAERKGANIVESVRPRKPVVLELGADADEAARVAHIAVRDGREIFIHKNTFDVFTGNPAVEPLIEALVRELGAAPRIFVIGVARDVCVTQAIEGMQARGYDTVGISDAAWGLGLEPEAETLGRWARGGEVAILDEVKRQEARGVPERQAAGG